MTSRRESESTKGDRAVVRAGRFSYEGLDRVMHEKARLGILASLAARSGSGGLLFNDLKQVCSLTDGNLSRHLAVLIEAGLIELSKDSQSGQRSRRQQTVYRLTAAGRRRFAEYINVLEGVVADAQRDAKFNVRERRSSKAWSPA